MSQNHDDHNSDPTKNSKKRSSTEKDSSHAADPVHDVNDATDISEATDTNEKRHSADESSTSDAALGSKVNDDSGAGAEKQQVKIDFPFSDVVRAQMPKAFETAEKVATEVKHHWKTEGDFTNLGLPHPVADMVASQALQKAKEVEKKLEEKGVFNLAKMGLEIAKSQFENLKKKI